jgi:hypothetical protein
VNAQIFGTIYLGLFAPCVIAYMYLSSAFTSRLRKCHYETWLRLGSPSLFFGNSISNNRRMAAFLWRKDYLALQDIEIRNKGNWLRALFCANLILFVLLLTIGFSAGNS